MDDVHINIDSLMLKFYLDIVFRFCEGVTYIKLLSTCKEYLLHNINKLTTGLINFYR